MTELIPHNLKDPPSWGTFLLALVSQILFVGVLWGAQYMKIQWLESDLHAAVEDKGKLWAKYDALQTTLQSAQITLATVQDIKQAIHDQEATRDNRADALNSALNSVASGVGDLRMTLNVQIERLNNVISAFEQDRRDRHGGSQELR